MPRTKKLVNELPKVIEEKETTCECKHEQKQEKQEKQEPKKRGRKPKVVVKKQRVASAYATFVKDNYNSVRDQPTKDRFRILSEMWKTEKLKQTKL